MTSPLAMTANTPMASRTSIHTPEQETRQEFSEKTSVKVTVQNLRFKQTARWIGTLTDVVGFLRDQPALQGDHFNGIQSDLDDVVDERQERGEREGRHEDGGEAELDH